MPSSDRRHAVAFALLLAATALAPRAMAQKDVQGFALERLYPSAPGGGWFVMDTLDMRGGLGGGMELQSGYSRSPLQVPGPAQSLHVVSDQAFADFGFAVTWDRWRLYLNLDAPLLIQGQSGIAGDYRFTAPSVNLAATTPDIVADPRFGLDVRLFGDPKGPFRLGAGAQLFLPTGGKTGDYDTDGTFRGMLRVLAAGDVGRLTYAGQLGVHIRPLDEAPTPGSPQGSELLFGFAAGPRFPVTRSGNTSFIVGPEFYGETAFRSFLSGTATGFEGLLTARVEGTADDGAQLRFKLGTGAGLDPNFGAPEWRIVVGVELFDHDSDRDKDGVPDSKDACPDTPGAKTKDPKTNGCPAPTEQPGEGR